MINIYNMMMIRTSNLNPKTVEKDVETLRKTFRNIKC